MADINNAARVARGSAPQHAPRAALMSAAAAGSRVAPRRTGFVTRATRLPVAVPVIYRASPEDGWATGSTLDISRSGLLFLPSATTTTDSQLDIVVLLSNTGIGADVPLADMQCSGRLVRTTTLADGRPALALTFDDQPA